MRMGAIAAWTAGLLILSATLGLADPMAPVADRMLLALGRGDLAGVERALSEGADASERMEGGMTPLHVAAFQGSAEIVAALVRSGADVDAQEGSGGSTPLIAAAAADKVLVQELLLRAGADPALCDRSGRVARDYSAPSRGSPRDGLRAAYGRWLAAAEEAARGRLGMDSVHKAAAGSAYEELKERRGQMTEERREGDRAKRGSEASPPPAVRASGRK